MDFPPKLDSFIKFEQEDVQQPIPGRFEEQVLKYPHRLAVKDGENELSYDEFNRAANRLARAIRIYSYLDAIYT